MSSHPWGVLRGDEGEGELGEEGEEERGEGVGPYKFLHL